MHAGMVDGGKMTCSICEKDFIGNVRAITRLTTEPKFYISSPCLHHTRVPVEDPGVVYFCGGDLQVSKDFKLITEDQEWCSTCRTYHGRFRASVKCGCGSTHIVILADI